MKQWSDKKKKKIIEEAERMARDSEFVEANLSIGFINHKTTKRAISILLKKIQDYEDVWKSNGEPTKYFIGYNQAKDDCMLLYESWIERVIGGDFLSNLKQKENIDKMFPLTNDHYAKIQIDLLKRKERNVNSIHKYMDSQNKYQLCPSTKVYDGNGEFVNNRHHYKEPLTHEWMEELRELNPDHIEFLNYLENKAGPGTYDVPVGSSLHLETVMDLSSVASFAIPPKEDKAYDMKYQQENYDTCGISALSSALHIFIHTDMAKSIILQKQKYMVAHKKKNLTQKTTR